MEATILCRSAEYELPSSLLNFPPKNIEFQGDFDTTRKSKKF